MQELEAALAEEGLDIRKRRVLLPWERNLPQRQGRNPGTHLEADLGKEPRKRQKAEGAVREAMKTSHLPVFLMEQICLETKRQKEIQSQRNRNFP